MIKKLSLSLVLSFFTIALFSQTIVSTSPENKNVILEEFTGIHCVYCPDGHVIAQSIQNNNPGDVFIINIHEGGFASPSAGEPDFRTPFGTAIANQAFGGPTGHSYPAGSVNRHVFSGGVTAMSRSAWTSASNTTLGQSSYVNVGVEAEINVQTNELEVHVEAYYTGDSPENTNLINIALLQNNTLGPQIGGGQGNNYNHMHRLVHLVTGQWGETIPNTTEGSFYDDTFTYTLPEEYNDVPVDILNLEIVAFVTETHQEIISGSGCYPTFSGITETNDAYLKSIDNIDNDCQTSVSPYISVQNLGQDEVTSLDIEYSINGGATENFNWTGSILSLYTEDIALPEIFNLEETNTIDVSIQDDDNNSNNDVSETFDGIYGYNKHLKLTIDTDSNGDETTWELRSASGSVLTSGGPYDNNETINKNINLSPGCFSFHLFDSNNNGGPNVTLKDFSGDGETIYETDGNFGSSESIEFATVENLAISNHELQNVSIYPNPTSNLLNIKNAENSSIEVYNILGQLIFTKSNILIEEKIDVSKLQTGSYFIKISKENEIVTKRFIVSK